MNVKDSEDKPDTAFELAKRRFKQASDADKRQREREREGLRFQVPENQWTQAAKDARAGGPGVPARPMLSVSKLDQPIRMITNQERNAKLGIQVHPLSEGANDDTAGVLQDLYRAIERDSNAAQARSWAFDRAVKVGRGWYRITTEYDENASDDGPDAFDQVIRIRRILDQSMVYVDPSATETDFSDARYLFMTAWVPVSTFKREYPKAERSASREFLVDSAEPEWVSGEGEDKAVLVAEHWEKEYTYEDLTVGDQTRKVEKCTVYVTKMTGAEIVEPRQQWNGHLIPFVPVLGRELQPFDEERRFEGVIGPNMDAQRAYNYALSSAVEGAALEPKAPFVGVEGQFEGHGPQWEQANIRNFAYLEYKPVQLPGGGVAPPPARVQVDGSRMQLSVGLAQAMEGALQSGTMQYDPSLGRPNGLERSGRAIQLQQQQGNEATSDFLANLADNSLRYEAKIVLDLIPSIYDRPGRVARILDEEEKTRAVVLNAPFVEDKASGMPQALQGPAPAGVQPKQYDLAKGRYAVAVSVGRSRQTRMEEGAEELGQILTTRPELLPILGPLYFEYRDFPGAPKVVELLRRMRDEQYPMLRDADEQGTPEDALRENVMLKQQIQQMGQAMQEMQQALEQETAKLQADLQKAAMEGASKERIAAINAESQQRISDQKAALAVTLAKIKAGHEDAQADKDVGREITKQTAVVPLKTFAASFGKPLEADKGRV
jgi:hypothetical protein